LTKKDQPFSWTDACEKALKTTLTQAPVLAYPLFDSEFLLETDASGSGLGAVLSQRQDDKSIQQIAFASRTLQPHEKQYGISELEALGVVWAVKQFRHIWLPLHSLYRPRGSEISPKHTTSVWETCKMGNGHTGIESQN
jgi:hypothetical protein